MDCPECRRLMEERGKRHRRYFAMLQAIAERKEHPQLMSLEIIVEETRIDLEFANTRLKQHQDRHAVPNRGRGYSA
jgi:hypothetical protein